MNVYRNEEHARELVLRDERIEQLEAENAVLKKELGLSQSPTLDRTAIKIVRAGSLFFAFYLIFQSVSERALVIYQSVVIIGLMIIFTERYK